MTTTPDPKTVREIARTFLTDPDADELKYVVRSYIGYAGGAEHEAWCDAVRVDAEKATVTTTASWPDERPHDATPLTAAELAELTASIDHLSGPDAFDEDRLEPALIPVTHYVPRLLAMVAQERPQNERDSERLPSITADVNNTEAEVSATFDMTIDEVRMLLAERDERDADVRAVAALLEAVGGNDKAALDAAVLEACEQFVDRIAALEARDAKGGEQR